MTTRWIPLPRLGLIPFAVALVCCIGCGDGRIRTYPTTGAVLVDGRPADGATVIFCPASGAEKFMRERPWGETDDNGQFIVTTFDRGDGAPAGDYTVMIRWPGKQAIARPGEDSERVERAADRLKGRYFHPQKSGITATVESGKNDLAPFELSLQP